MEEAGPADAVRVAMKKLRVVQQELEKVVLFLNFFAG